MPSPPGGPRTWLAAAFRRHARSRRVVVWGVLLTGLGVALCFVPLFDTLGFEFSFALSFLAAFAGADLGAAAVRRLRETPGAALERSVSPPLLLLRLSGQVAAVCAVLLLGPLLAISLNAVRVQNCDWPFGLETFLLMPVVSAALTSALGVALGVIAGPRRWLSLLLPHAALVAVVLAALWQFYSNPAVYSYNLLTGFFPGNLYDEQVALTAPFFWVRLFQIAWVGALLLAAAAGLDLRTLALSRRRPAMVPWRRRALLGAGALALCAALLSFVSGRLGFAISADEIGAQLGARYDTEHFVIYYPAGSAIEQRIDVIAEEHEFRLHQVVRTLGVEPSEKITSYYFDDPEAKYRAMGARRVFMAKPWRKEIYLNHEGFPHEVLRHEIVHVVAGEFGDRLFGTSVGDFLGLPILFNVGMIEGIAVAVDWPDHFNKALTPHQSVKAMLELDYAPEVSSLFSPRFFANSSSRSYTAAGSLLRWLLDQYGAEPLRRLYRSGGEFETAYDLPRETLIAGWRAAIDATYLPPGAAEMVRERFRRTSIFQRICPHAVARWRVEVDELISRRRFDEAVDLARHICDAVPDEPGHEMDLANLLAAVGRDGEAESIYRTLAGDVEEISTTMRAEALLNLTTVAARRGDWAQVVNILDTAAALSVDDGTMRNIVARRLAALSRWPSGAALRHYFWGTEPVSAAGRIGRVAAALAAEPESGLAQYLLGRNLIDEAPPADASAALARALDLGLPHPLLRNETARLLAAQAYQAGEYAQVERAAKILMEPSQSQVLQLLGADWIDRLHWKQQQK